jgi:DNA invertase Pin-like site-specific DNA recombinase
MGRTAGGRGRERMSGWDCRQAVMAVANMVESLLRGGGAGGGEPDGEDHPVAPVEASDRVVRQSTVAQVRFNTESTQRQYGLVGTAAEFGWLAEQIVVVDADLGVSGRFGAERDGYRQIVARMCMGEVGAVFGLEVSRFGRSNADLTRLMELARLTDTLLIDTDGVYDLANVNDRILLGLKGQMSEIELHFLLGRLPGAKLAAAQRGDLRHPLPVGSCTTTTTRWSRTPTSRSNGRSRTCSRSSSPWCPRPVITDHSRSPNRDPICGHCLRGRR